ncbi:multiple C2 and transmembrane domain-containing protein-like [Schistocerca piceifrons]|uniref:multiple C2 and transmembrane domain-containing protein-like n=1 Tax=Schistocerca piceifrons TaxID=274613 RepID=UPI001F5EA6D8|nr:multiple C2 and transmembrane domain-containing protein-like [Schistocerca piceifrons]
MGSRLLQVEDATRRREAALRQHTFFLLRVLLRRGVDLAPRDKAGTSDPYVKFKVGGRLLYKSRTIYRDLNPVWDESFCLPIEDPFTPVHIKVFDYDWGLQDDFMGSAYLDVSKLDLGRATEITLPLRDPAKTTEYLGELQLTATLWPRSQEDKEQLLTTIDVVDGATPEDTNEIFEGIITWSTSTCDPPRYGRSAANPSQPDGMTKNKGKDNCTGTLQIAGGEDMVIWK